MAIFPILGTARLLRKVGPLSTSIESLGLTLNFALVSCPSLEGLSIDCAELPEVRLIVF